MWIELVSDVELFKRWCKYMQPNVACTKGQGWAGGMHYTYIDVKFDFNYCMNALNVH